ncbi:histone-lysine N-methyltransferas-like protein [Plenodomus tracheiphilus IPT5]|uniref:Histone-lysine N-methyltransferase, H3 lysine-79 specific n=1 Tax=Plenodomus tracheiphilus IPT5 TaxID=1408161 RepID=A0A6A7B7S5_9PLEO|nr:histone-lysine N-methyltransferas-like protein [Plenodomus tracheiphilus IPT5]
MFIGKPKIKRKTVLVQRPPSITTNSSPAPRTPSATRPGAGARSYSAPRAPTNRYQASTSAHVRVQEPRKAAVAESRKRKGTDTPQWASSDESSEGDEEDRLGLGVKRLKMGRVGSSSTEPMNLNRTLEPDLRRRIRIREEGGGESGKVVGNGVGGKTNGVSNGTSNGTANGTPSIDAKKTVDLSGVYGDKKPVSKKGTYGRLIHGLDMSSGDGSKDYKPAFPGTTPPTILELQYPSPSRPERFEAVDPLDSSEGYSPLNDIYFSIEEIITHYLPPDLATTLSSDTEGTVRLLKRAVSKNSPSDFTTHLSKFNTLIRENLSNGTIPRIIDDMHAIPLSLVKRITAQSYNRIVSPHAHRLRKVKGKETTYGELLTPFVHKIFAQTGLNSSHVFVDLGSGVGNVVLQAALQTGAESWGIEKMDLAASLGTKQADEIKARSRLWNIHLGSLRLIHGDFLDSVEIDAVLPRADVILVNNKVFGEALNNSLLQKFLDLKVGCRVVSLESFGGGGAGVKVGVRNEQSIAGLFEEERFESGSASVSWAGESVEYFIARKVR